MCRNFCLLRFRPEPVRPLSSNLGNGNLHSRYHVDTHSLEWTLVLHTLTDHKWSRTQAVHEPSLQVAGLQVHATTLG